MESFPQWSAFAVALWAGSFAVIGMEDSAGHRRSLVSWTGSETEAPRGIELARTEEQFVCLWQRHLGEEETGRYDMYNELAVPRIDFDRCMVIAIFEDKRFNCAGYRVKSISERDGALLFRYDDMPYQTTGGADEVSPYGFFVLEKTSREIVVEENVQRRRGPPIWEERVTFSP